MVLRVLGKSVRNRHSSLAALKLVDFYKVGVVLDLAKDLKLLLRDCLSLGVVHIEEF